MSSMTKNSWDRSLLSQLSLCQTAPGRLSADTPVSSRNDELQEDGRALWLAPGEASWALIPLYQSKGTVAESLHGGGACCSCERWSSHSGHCRRHKPLHGNTVSAPAWGMSPQLSQLLKQMRTSQVTGLMSARADEGFSSLSAYRSQDANPIPSMSRSQWGSVTLPPTSCSPGHQSRHPEGPQNPRLGYRSGHSPAHRAFTAATEGKASLWIPAGCHTAANQGKVTK